MNTAILEHHYDRTFFSHQSQAEDIAAYIRAGFTPESEARIGLEIETICLHDSNRRADYEAMRDVLQRLAELMQFRLCTSKQRPVSLSGPSGSVTLEPGCQLEWASPAVGDLDQLMEHYQQWLAARDRALASQQLHPTNYSVDAEYDCDQAWPPSNRYEKMRKKFSERPNWNPMQRTAGIHVSLDYSSDADWARKFRVMLSAIPSSQVLFANSPGTLRGEFWQSMRPLSWLDLDPARTHLPNDAFRSGFTIDQYANWAASIACMVHSNVSESLREKSLQKLGDVFTMIRSKQVLEVRCNDRVPDAMVPVIAAFWTGLLYDPQSCEAAWQDSDWFNSRPVWYQSLEEACRSGADVSPALMQRTQTLLSLSIAGLRRLGTCPQPLIQRLESMQRRVASSA